MKSYRIIIVGCGSMGRTWAKYALQREDTVIVGLVDLHEEAARGFAASLDLTCPVFTDLQEAIHATKANLVMDITIPAAHRSVTVTALRAGCHVMGEKPLAASMEEAKEMVAVAEASGRSYAVMQNRRYLKGIRAFRSLVQDGMIGKPGSMHADFFLGPHFGGFRDTMDHPLLLDMAIHTFDQARFILGADPVTVYCHEYNPIGSWYKGNASAVCIFEMTDGSVFTYRGSWCAEGAPTSWEAAWRVTGTRGTAIWDGEHAPYAEVVGSSEEKKFLNAYERKDSQIQYSGKEGHPGCLDEMFAALKEGRKAETDCSDNIQSLAMVFGAIESASTGKKIRIDR